MCVYVCQRGKCGKVHGKPISIYDAAIIDMSMRYVVVRYNKTAICGSNFILNTLVVVRVYV